MLCVLTSLFSATVTGSLGAKFLHFLYCNDLENDRGRTSKPFHKGFLWQVHRWEIYFSIICASFLSLLSWMVGTGEADWPYQALPLPKADRSDLFLFQKWLREGSPLACKIKHILLRNCYVNLGFTCEKNRLYGRQVSVKRFHGGSGEMPHR